MTLYMYVKNALMQRYIRNNVTRGIHKFDISSPNMFFPSQNFKDVLKQIFVSLYRLNYYNT